MLSALPCYLELIGRLNSLLPSSSSSAVVVVVSLIREREREREFFTSLLHRITNRKKQANCPKNYIDGQTIRLSQTKVLRPSEFKAAPDIEFETSFEESAKRSEQSDETSAGEEGKSCIETCQQKRRQRQTKRSEPRFQEKSRQSQKVEEIQTKRQGFRRKPLISF